MLPNFSIAVPHPGKTGQGGPPSLATPVLSAFEFSARGVIGKFLFQPGEDDARAHAVADAIRRDQQRHFVFALAFGVELGGKFLVGRLYEWARGATRFKSCLDEDARKRLFTSAATQGSFDSDAPTRTPFGFAQGRPRVLVVWRVVAQDDKPLGLPVRDRMLAGAQR
jgi:hypothetical protein